MRKQIFITIGAGIIVLGLLALGWWWFLNRPSSAPPVQNTGAFGSSGNKPPLATQSGGGQTNIGSPVIHQGVVVPNLASQYTVSPVGMGTYTIVPLNGAGVIPGAGTYVLTVGGVTGAYTVTPLGNAGGITTYSIAIASSTSTTIDLGVGTTSTPGVDWLNLAGGGTVFNPTDINQIDGSNPSGGILPNFNGSVGGSSGNNGLGLAGTALAAAGIGALTCSGVLSQVLALGGIGYAAGAAAGGGLAVGGGTASLAFTVQVNDNVTHGQLTSIGATQGLDTGLHKGDVTTDFLSCMTRGLAKVALNQMTTSVVNWINGGFGAFGGAGGGGPGFVTNPQQFFQGIADQAAGQYIKGSALSFLCSPFNLQIRVAIAQSYANRNAMQCTLTKVVRNINNFMSGDFIGSGGWPAMLSFVTNPTNNPYGAYAYASAQLNYRVQTAVGEQQRQLSLGNGFLDLVKEQGCTQTATPPDASGSVSVTKLGVQDSDGRRDRSSTAPMYKVCNLVHTTPGHAIAQALGATNSSTFTELDMAKSFDEIISALITKLVTSMFQSGLSNLSGPTGNYADNFYTPEQLAAQSTAQGLFNQMQSDVSTEQSYGAVAQGSISDIQNTQQQLNTLSNCWDTLAGVLSSNTALNSNVSAAQAQVNATQASTTFAALQAQVDAFNNTITSVNASIALLQQLQSDALSAGSNDDASALSSRYNNAKASGQILSQTDVTNAQQDRVTLQSQLSSLNAQTSAGLQQCHAAIR